MDRAPRRTRGRSSRMAGGGAHKRSTGRWKNEEETCNHGRKLKEIYSNLCELQQRVILEEEKTSNLIRMGETKDSPPPFLHCLKEAFKGCNKKLCHIINKCSTPRNTHLITKVRLQYLDRGHNDVKDKFSILCLMFQTTPPMPRFDVRTNDYQDKFRSFMLKAKQNGFFFKRCGLKSIIASMPDLKVKEVKQITTLCTDFSMSIVKIALLGKSYRRRMRDNLDFKDIEPSSFFVRNTKEVLAIVTDDIAGRKRVLMNNMVTNSRTITMEDRLYFTFAVMENTLHMPRFPSFPNDPQDMISDLLQGLGSLVKDLQQSITDVEAFVKRDQKEFYTAIQAQMLTRIQNIWNTTLKELAFPDY
ncbi:hypothetical protein CsatB_016461 [Cannabis sativa]